MRKKLLIVALIIVSILSFTKTIDAESHELDFFYKTNCQHCKEEMKWLKEYENNSDISVRYYNIDESENIAIFQAALKEHNLTIPSVPLLIDNDQAYQGYISLDDYLLRSSSSPNQACKIEEPCDQKILGFINPKKSPLILIAALLGLIDGFNPCAMWVLVILLTFLIQVENRKKMALLGGTFIVVSGLMYYLIIASWLNVRPLLEHISSIHTLLAIILIIMGSFALYSAHFKKKGCEAQQGPQRKKIIHKIQSAVNSTSTFYAIIAIIVLAVSVNLVELTCSLGIPLMFTETLHLKQVNSIQFHFYLLIYILFFVLDDLVIFGIALKTFTIKGISNRFTKAVQIFGALLLILFGLLIIFTPELLGI